MRGFFPRVLFLFLLLFCEFAIGDLRERRLGEDAGVTGREVLRRPQCDLHRLPLAVPPEIALDGKGLGPRADSDEEAAQVRVADDVLPAVAQRQPADHLVIEGGFEFAHVDAAF
jgi:hypothetical protein